MFVRVAVLSGSPQHYLTLPQTAVTYNPYGATVFLVTKQPDGKLTAAADLRDHGPDAWRSGRGAQGRQGGR